MYSLHSRSLLPHPIASKHAEDIDEPENRPRGKEGEKDEGKEEMGRRSCHGDEWICAIFSSPAVSTSGCVDEKRRSRGHPETDRGEQLQGALSPRYSGKRKIKNLNPCGAGHGACARASKTYPPRLSIARRGKGTKACSFACATAPCGVDVASFFKCLFRLTKQELLQLQCSTSGQSQTGTIGRNGVMRV